MSIRRAFSFILAILWLWPASLHAQSEALMEAYNRGKALKEALTQGEIDAATFFSPRTAESFARLVAKAGLSDALRGVRAICLSQAVADKITYLPWDGVKVAERPTQESLLAILEAC